MLKLGDQSISTVYLGGEKIKKAYLGESVVFDVSEPPVPTYTITASIDPAGSGTVSGAGTYQAGDTVTITAAPGDGYQFTGWQENGVTVSEDAAYTFTVTGDRTLTAVFVEIPASRLPAGYTEVEYIQSSGTQFIDTGEKATATTKVVMDVEPTSAGTSSYTHFFDSSYISSSSKRLFRMSWSNKGVSACLGLMSTVSYTAVSSSTQKKRMVLQLDVPTKTAMVDDISKTLSNNAISASVKNLSLLGYTKTSPDGVSAKLYSCQMYTGSALIYNFVPCIDPSGAVGLYDLVGGTFYPNSGTDTFVHGPAV